MLGLAWMFSTDRRAIRYKTVAWGLGLQIAFAFLVMRWEFGRILFEKLGAAANWLLDFAYYGTAFVFGDLGQKNSPRGFFFAFQPRPTIIFVAALFAVLYYLGIMQLFVKAAARVMTSLMGASGAESLNVAASIFMGQTRTAMEKLSLWVRTSFQGCVCNTLYLPVPGRVAACFRGEHLRSWARRCRRVLILLILNSVRANCARDIPSMPRSLPFSPVAPVKKRSSVACSA